MGVFAWWMNSTHARSSTGELALDLRVALLQQASAEFVAVFSSTRDMLLALSDGIHAGLFVVDSSDPTLTPFRLISLIFLRQDMLLALSDVMHSGLFTVDSSDPSFSLLPIAAAIWPAFHRMPLINLLGFQAAPVLVR
eukprot:jgi/Mesvir1/11190/Mv14579-RA.1